MNRLIFILRSLQYRIQWFGLFGLVLILLSTSLFATLTQSKQEELSKARIAFNQTNQLVVTKNNQVKSPDNAQITGYYIKQLPNILSKEDSIKSVLVLAEKNKIELKTGQYNLTTLDHDQVTTVKMTFPTQGTYPQIKHFISAIIETLPHVAINQMTLRRSASSIGMVQADIELGFYFANGY